MDIKKIRYFEALHRLRSFKLAASELGVTHTALTKSLQRLEAELGLSLLDRTTRSVVPTPAGDRLANHAHSVLSEIDEFGRAANAIRKGSGGTFSLGASPLPMVALVNPALQTYAPAITDLRVHARMGSDAAHIQALLSRELDFALLGGVAPAVSVYQEAIKFTTLPGEPVVIIARHDHPVVRSNAPSTEYLNFRWVGVSLSEFDLAVFPEPFRSEMVRQNIPQLQVDEIGDTFDLVERTDFLTSLPLSAARRYAQRANVALVNYPFPVVAQYTLARLRTRTPQKSATAFSDIVERLAKQNSQDRLDGNAERKRRKRVAERFG